MAKVIPSPPLGFTIDDGVPPPPLGFNIDSGSSTIGRSERVMRGLADPLVGLSQLIIPMLPKSMLSQLEQSAATGLPQFNTNMGGSSLDPAQFQENIKSQEQEYQTKRGDTGIDWWRLLGNVTGTAPVAAVMPGSGPTLLSTGVRSALSGGAVNALMPATGGEPLLEQKMQQFGTGAVTGGILGPAVQGIAKVVAPKLSSGVQELMKRGVNLTPGQVLGKTPAKIEETLTSIPGLGDFIKNAQRRSVESFNKAAYDEVLAPIGAKYTDDAIGHTGVKIVGDKLSDAYDALVPDLKLVPDQEFFTALDNAVSNTSLMSETAAKQFEKIVTTMLPRGPLEGAPLKAMESKLTQEISRFGRSQDPSDQMISDALGEVRSAVLDNLARVNPAHAEMLAAINGGWRNLVTLERAAGNTKEGVFTPEVLLNASKAADTSVRKRATARGAAGAMQSIGKIGNEVLGRTYPDSGTPGRILMTGAALGYVEPTMLAAAAIGAAPYSQMGQKVATAILAKRPELAGPIRALLERSAVPIAGTIAPAAAALVSTPAKKNRHKNKGR